MTYPTCKTCRHMRYYDGIQCGRGLDNKSVFIVAILPLTDNKIVPHDEDFGCINHSELEQQKEQDETILCKGRQIRGLRDDSPNTLNGEQT